MAGFQNFTPRTANLAKVWEGFNPAANFLGGMKAVRQMDLDEAAEARLREAAEVDRMVKETMLPYEVRLANAKIGATQAQAGYYAARAERDTEDATAAALFENFQGKSYGEMKGLLKPQTSSGEAAPAPTPQRNFSMDGVNSNIGETPSGALSSFAEEPDDLFGSLGVTREELTNPKYAVASAPQGASTDVPPNNEAMQVLEKRKADQPSSPTSLLSEQQSEDLKGIRSDLYKDSNPLLNMPEIQAREAKKKEDSLGSFITNEYSFLQEQENLTALLSKKNPERVARGAAVEYMKSQFNSEAAKKFGISPAAVPMLVYSSRGVLRSSEEIDQIHGAMKQGYVDLPDDKGQMLRYEVKSPEDAVALTEKQRMTPINRAATGGPSQEDLTKAMANYNAAKEQLAQAQSTGDAVQINGALAVVGAAEGYLNQSTGGDFYRRKHEAVQSDALRALNNVGNSKVYWNGAAYDDPSVKGSQDPMAKLSAEQFLANQVTTGAIPTVTFVRNEKGEAVDINADAALAYTTKMGVQKTLVAAWNGPNLDWFAFTPSAKEGEQLVPITTKAPPAPPAGEGKKSSEAASPNQSGKRLGAALKPAIRNTANFLKGPTTDELLNRADYVATGIRNNITAPAVEWAAGIAGEDLDLGRTPNPSVADRDKKQLTAKDRAAILSRSQNPLTNLFLNK